jgi:hypothetical protein
MRIRALTVKTMVTGAILLYGLLAIVAILVLAAVGIPAPIALIFAVVTVGAGILNSIRFANRTWVQIDANVTWQKWNGKGASTWATPSGSVPIGAIAGVVVTPQDSPVRQTMRRGFAVQLHLTDGGVVVLPFFTPVHAVTQQFAELVRALRGALPPHVAVDTSALGTALSLAPPTGHQSAA